MTDNRYIGRHLFWVLGIVDGLVIMALIGNLIPYFSGYAFLLLLLLLVNAGLSIIMLWHAKKRWGLLLLGCICWQALGVALLLRYFAIADPTSLFHQPGLAALRDGWALVLLHALRVLDWPDIIECYGWQVPTIPPGDHLRMALLLLWHLWFAAALLTSLLRLWIPGDFWTWLQKQQAPPPPSPKPQWLRYTIYSLLALGYALCWCYCHHASWILTWTSIILVLLHLIKRYQHQFSTKVSLVALTTGLLTILMGGMYWWYSFYHSTHLPYRFIWQITGEQLIGALDILDLNTIYGARAPIAPHGLVLGTLALSYRLLVLWLCYRWLYYRLISYAAARMMPLARIITDLDHQDPTIRQNARNRLQQLADYNPAILPLLLNDVDLRLREIATAVLRDKGVGAIVPLLRHADWWVRKEAVQLLGELQADEAIEDLLPLLQDPNTWVRELVAETLGTLAARQTWPALVELLRDPHSSIRQAASAALVKLQAREAIATVVGLLQDSNWQVAKAALELLTALQAAEVGAHIMPLLGHSHALLRQCAAESLGQLGYRRAIAELTKLLRDPQVAVRKTAIEALVELQAQESLPAIIPLLQDEWSVKIAAVKAIAALGRSEHGHMLIPLLQEEEDHVSQDVRRLRERLVAKKALTVDINSDIICAFENEWVLRLAVIKALGRLKVHAAWPHILPLLQSSDATLRQAAVTALINIRAHEALGALIDLLKAPQATVRFAATRVLQGLQNRQAIRHIISLLQDQDSNVREAAAEALVALEAHEAIEALKALLQDQEPSVRWVVTSALEKLQRKSNVRQADQESPPPGLPGP